MCFKTIEVASSKKWFLPFSFNQSEQRIHNNRPIRGLETVRLNNSGQDSPDNSPGNWFHTNIKNHFFRWIISSDMISFLWDQELEIKTVKCLHYAPISIRDFKTNSDAISLATNNIRIGNQQHQLVIEPRTRAQ